jgi:hypothetical protein
MSTDGKESITVEQAVERLSKIAERARGPLKLGVPYNPGFPTMGPSPVKRVISIHEGFDWNKGTVFLDLGERLFATGPDQEKLQQSIKTASDAIGWIGVTLRSTLTPVAKLKVIKEHYDAYVKPPRAPEKVKP